MRHKKFPLIRALLIILSALAVVSIIWFLHNNSNNPKGPQSDQVPQEWNLILVNHDHPIPAGYSPELTLLSNGRQVDQRIYPDLQNMFDAARSHGLELFVREGYRTTQEQQLIFDERVNSFILSGSTPEEAELAAAKWVSPPGTSEHQLGLAVDINADTSISSSDDVYSWLEQNAYKYGFIQRYPPDKTQITGINNEPWHYRYVGYEAAEEMHSKGICLEEYLDTLQSSDQHIVN